MHFNPLFPVPIIGIAAVIIADQLARRHAYNKMNRLYAAGNFDELLDFLDGRYAKTFFPTYNRLYAIYNAYEKMGDVKAAENELDSKLFEELEKESAAEEAPADSGLSC